MTEASIERIRRRLKAKVAKRKQPKATPPRYDDVYFKGLAIADLNSSSAKCGVSNGVVSAAPVFTMKLPEHTTGYSGHVVTVRWRGYGRQHLLSLAEVLKNELLDHASEIHLQCSRPGELLSYVVVHVPRSRCAKDVAGELVEILSPVFSDIDCKRVVVDTLLPSKTTLLDHSSAQSTTELAGD